MPITVSFLHLTEDFGRKMDKTPGTKSTALVNIMARTVSKSGNTVKNSSASPDVCRVSMAKTITK